MPLRPSLCRPPWPQPPRRHLPPRTRREARRPGPEYWSRSRAPTVGTFYAQEKPDAPPYVTVGSRVNQSTVVGQIEAMKLFNEIPAGCNGVIAEVLVQNQQPVEYEQVLFRVDPTA